jgi:hypothetical protein
MYIVLILFSLSLDTTTGKPQNIKGLLKWNMAELDLVISPPTVNGGISLRNEILEFNYLFIKPRIGIGTTVVDCFANYDDFYCTFLPIQINALIWYNKRGLFGTPFVSMLSGYCHIGFIHSPGQSVSLDAGLEYTPGILLNLRFGYFTKIGDPLYSGLYLSVGAFLGAVHKIW